MLSIRYSRSEFAKMWMIVGALLALCTGVISQPLKSYDVDPNSVTISGISAGAAMAMQMHVAYSASIHGSGHVAGVVFYCAQGSVLEALQVCMGNPEEIILSELYTATSTYQSQGIIDPVSNLAGDPVVVIHGTLDQTVFPAGGPKIVEYYQNYGANVVTNFNLNAGHGQPTLDYGVPCGDTQSPYINRCNYDGAFEILNHMYGGNLQRPTSSQPITGQVLTYDQAEFINWPIHSIADRGYIYVPSGCQEKVKRKAMPMCNVTPGEKVDCGWPGITQSQCESRNCCYNTTSSPFCFCGTDSNCEVCDVAPSNRSDCGSPGITESQCNQRGCCYLEEAPYYCYRSQNSQTNQCKLHVAVHGCLQQEEEIGDDYVRNGGYLQTAELNNIVVLFPQTKAQLTTGNPNGCFDWWGYDDGFDEGLNLDTDYSTKTGPQMRAIKAMIDRVTG